MQFTDLVLFVEFTSLTFFQSIFCIEYMISDPQEPVVLCPKCDANEERRPFALPP